MIKRFAFLLLFFVLVNTLVLAAPTATLNADPTGGNAPLDVTFTGSCDGDNAMRPILSCKIDLGDGNTLDFNALTGPHTYHIKGTYDATLTATNTEGESDDVEVEIDVLTQKPTANLAVSQSDIDIGDEVTFTGSCTDPEDELASCKIDFDDGNSDVDFTSGMTHKFYEVKTYIVTLTATDNDGETGADSDSINVDGGSAPTIENKDPSPGSTVNNSTPTVSFDIVDSGSGVDISTLFLFIDGTLITDADETASGDDYEVSWTFSSSLSNGHEVNVSLSVEDDLGNGTDANWEFTVDLDGPTSLDIEINGDDTYTDTRDVTLDLEATGASQCRLKNDGGDWQPWFNYTTSKSWSLQDSDDTRTVHFQCKDSAGNESGSVSDTIILDRDGPREPSDFDATYDDNDDEVDLDWSKPSDRGNSGIDHFCLYRGEHSGLSDMDLVTCNIDDDDTSYENDVDNLDDGDVYYYRIRAVDRAGNPGDISDAESVTIGEAIDTGDTTGPYLKWEEPNDDSTVNGDVTLKVKSYDSDSSVRFVKFYVDDSIIDTDESASSQRYSVVWDSTTVADGEHVLKAVSKNRSGKVDKDTTVKTITVTTSNGIAYVPNGDKDDAETAIDEADDAKEDAANIISDMQKLGITVNNTAVTKLSDASKMLDDAQDLYDDEDYNAAKDKADDALELFEELIEEVSIENYGSEQSYAFETEKLEELLLAAGLKQELVDECKQMVEDFTVNRRISFRKVTQGDNTYYKIVVKATARNDSDERKTIQLLEIIPKELAENAEELGSSREFTTVIADPIIKWELGLEPNQTGEVIYFLKADMTKEEADDLIAAGVMGAFNAPPAILASETAVTAEDFQATAGGTPTGFFALSDLLTWLGWIVIAIFAIVIAIFVLKSIGGKGEERPFGLHSVTEEKGMFSKMGGKFSGLGRGKGEEDYKPKWAYKG